MTEKEKKDRESLGRVMADWLELPGDLVLDLPKITLVGYEKMVIENHRGVIECSANRMRINIARGYLEIQGEDLQIRSLCAEEVQLIGHIKQIRFLA